MQLFVLVNDDNIFGFELLRFVFCCALLNHNHLDVDNPLEEAMS